jgi:hypothetical protein
MSEKPHNRRQALGVMLAIVALLTVAGCSASAGTRDEGTTSEGASRSLTATVSSPAARYLGPLTSAISYGTGDLLLTPPSGVRAKVSWQQAYANVRCTMCSPQFGPGITLAVATTPQSGTARPDGSLRPAVDRVLSYVFVWGHNPCAAAGPAGGPITECTSIDLVDAVTGAQESWGEDGPGL